jgi:hypothetical protein
MATENKTKYFTSEEINKKFHSLTKDKRIGVLLEAIDYMQSYNGRSKILCIALAMGYDNYQGDNKSFFKVIN